MKRDFSDTSPEVARRYREALAALSGADRVRMACDMFDTARTLVSSSWSDEARRDSVESRIRLLTRFYGRDLDPALLERVERMIRAGGAQPRPR